MTLCRTQKRHHSPLSSSNLLELIPPLCRKPRNALLNELVRRRPISVLRVALCSDPRDQAVNTEEVALVLLFSAHLLLPLQPARLSPSSLRLQAEKFNGSEHPVVAIKGARLSDFGGRSLSALFSSTVMVNPDLPEAFRLRAW